MREAKTVRDLATHPQSHRHTPTHRQKYRHMNHNERPADVIFVLTRDGRGWHDWWAWGARITKIEVFLTKRLCLGQWGVVFRPCFSVPRSWRRGHWTEVELSYGLFVELRIIIEFCCRSPSNFVFGLSSIWVRRGEDFCPRNERQDWIKISVQSI